MAAILGLALDELRASRTSIKWQRYGPSVVPAWVAEMDARPCPAVVEAVGAAMARGDTGYTWIAPYAEAAASFAEDTWHWTFDPAIAVAAPDVMIGILDLLQVLTERGDTVVVSPPVYLAFFGFIEGYGRHVGLAPLDPNGRLDPATLREAFAAAKTGGRAAVYLLCNPHNPTGTVHSADELATLADLAAEFDITVIADEIHAPLVLPGAMFTPYLSVPGGERGVSVFSASKAFNLAGLKSALVIAGEAAAPTVALIPEVATHGASHVAAIAHTAALNDGRDWLYQLLAELVVNRTALATRLAAEAPTIRHAPPAATFLAWLDLRATGLGDDPAAAILDRSGVALAEGRTFGDVGAGFARLNFATSPTVVDTIIDGVVAAVTR